MQFAYAAESLTPLAPDHVSVQKVEAPAALKKKAQEDPVAVVSGLHPQPRRAGHRRQHPGPAFARRHFRRRLQEMVGRRQARAEKERPLLRPRQEERGAAPARCARAPSAIPRWKICASPTARRRSSLALGRASPNTGPRSRATRCSTKSPSCSTRTLSKIPKSQLADADRARPGPRRIFHPGRPRPRNRPVGRHDADAARRARAEHLLDQLCPARASRSCSRRCASACPRRGPRFSSACSRAPTAAWPKSSPRRSRPPAARPRSRPRSTATSASATSPAISSSGSARTARRFTAR